MNELKRAWESLKKFLERPPFSLRGWSGLPFIERIRASINQLKSKKHRSDSGE